VARHYVALIAVLTAIIAAFEFTPALLSRVSPGALERASERTGWTDAAASHDIAFDIFLRVNDERRARGIPPLQWDEELASMAGRWSEEMIATGYRHSTPEFRAHPHLAGTGENIHMGSTNAAEAHVGWMRSDGHRDNLLAPGYTAVGIGVVCRNDGRMWATQIFGIPRGTPGAPPAATPAEPIVRDDEGPACPSPAGWPFAPPGR
jgi:uncharacterized protein YkwD